MQLEHVFLNIYSFGYSAGFLKGDAPAPTEKLDLIEFLDLAKSHELGGIEFPVDVFFAPAKLNELENFLGYCRKKQLDFFLAVDRFDPAYMEALCPIARNFSKRVIRIKMNHLGSVFYGGNRYESSHFEDSFVKFRQELRSILPLLKKYDICLAIENHQDISAAEIKQLASDLGLRYFGVNWDVGNSVSVGDSPASFFKQCGSLIRNVHLKDYQISKIDSGIKLTRCPLGAGYVNFAEIFDLLGSLKEKPTMSIELGAQKSRECHIAKAEYWSAYKITFSKELFSNFINERIEQTLKESDYERGLRGKSLTDRELQDIAESVDYLRDCLRGLK